MTQSLQAAIQAFEPQLPLAVAFSGGADSTALLLACAEKWPSKVLAVHVNHGLQAAAHAFELHCQDLCQRIGVPLVVLTVQADHSPGQSPEDAARIARYGALCRFALPADSRPPCASVALGQHADDQVETLLLALGRGAGLGGLSAMPSAWVRDGVQFYRPLLRVSAAEIRSVMAANGQGFIEDPTNTDVTFLRNRIRAHLMPALREVFPHYARTLARSAAHAAQAQSLLSELAQDDLRDVCGGDPASPQIKALQAISPARQANVLRHWLRQRHHTQASAAQLEALMVQIAACTTRGHRIHLRVGSGFVQRNNGALAWYNSTV
ncbi:MAG: tRNA lysidine(34) synthetase TilS [Betaproteobacteria bacterium]